MRRLNKVYGGPVNTSSEQKPKTIEPFHNGEDENAPRESGLAASKTYRNNYTNN